MPNLNVEGVDERTLDVLGFAHVGESVSEDVFQSMLELATENAGVVDALEAMRDNPETQAMWQFVITQGSGAVETLIGMSVKSGLLSKSDVRSAAKISSTRAPKERAWYKQVATVLMAAGYEAIQAAYAENLDTFRSEHSGETVRDALEDFLKAVGKSTLGDKVDAWTHPESGKTCATALSFRIDYNTPSRNGTKSADEDGNGVSEDAEAQA